MRTMMVKDLKEHVLCSRCKKFNYGLGPYQCKRGHMICPRCQPFTDVCPHPQCLISVDVNDPIRCHSGVDFLMDKVPVPCLYKDNGCTEKNQRGKLREHLFICPFRDLANVVNAVGGTETVEAGTGSRDRENDAETVVVEAMNEESVDGAGERDSGDDAETVIVEDVNDQNEEFVGGAGSHDGEGVVGNFTASDMYQTEETDGGASVGSPEGNKDDYVEVVLSDPDQNEENADRDNGNENEIRVGRTEVPVPLNRDDIMETDEQTQESDGVGVENGRVLSAAEDEVEIEMEDIEDNRDATMDEEENSYDDDTWMPEGDLESFSSSSVRKSTRKRKRPQRYSPIISETKAGTSDVEALESEEDHENVLTTHNTGPQRNDSKEYVEVFSELVIKYSFECTFCATKFRKRSRVIKHLASYHADAITEQINKAEKITFAVHRCCMFCDSRFPGKDDLREHISDMHKDKF